MISSREITSTWKSTEALEGAGVRLKRAFGFHQLPQLDPFLLLDDFHSKDPRDYANGFPWHPHRGIETITYVLQGQVEHGDSIGNRGVISSGDVQWMTSGSGIIHQEMPAGQKDGLMWGFQLWANLPASRKMMDPRYREVKSSRIPEITLDTGVKVRIICGEVDGAYGPVQDIVSDPEYLDITIPPDSNFSHSVKRGYTAFVYVIEGRGYFDTKQDTLIGRESLILFDDGDRLAFRTREEQVRFLLVSGKPLREPVAWYGPIVMNTEEQLRVAFEEYREGAFIKYKKLNS